MFKGYIPHTKATLNQGESIVFIGNQHILRWVKLYAILAFITAFAYYFKTLPFLGYSLAPLYIIPIIGIAYTWADSLLTEIVLTNKRFIYKRGVLSTDISELATGHIDSIKIHQSIFCKLFRFARVVIQCEGLDSIEIPFVTKPRALHRALKQSDVVPTPIVK